MKRIFFLFLLMPGICYSQNQIPEIGDNLIIVRTFDSPDIAFSNMADILYFSGLGISYSDRDLMMIEAHGEMNIFSSQLFIKVLQGDKTEIYIHGLYQITNWSRISNRGGKDTPQMKVWKECNSIAKKYEGAEILYSKLDINQ